MPDGLTFREIRNVRHFFVSKNMATSKLQRYLSDRLHKELYCEVKENYRPHWLKGLELDFFLEELSIGIEVQGGQHFAYTPFFHVDETAFASQIERDIYKKHICYQEGINLLYVEDTFDADAVFWQIKHMPKFNQRVQDELKEIAVLYAHELTKDDWSNLCDINNLIDITQKKCKPGMWKRKQHKRRLMELQLSFEQKRAEYEQRMQELQDYFLATGGEAVTNTIREKVKSEFALIQRLGYDQLDLFCGKAKPFVNEADEGIY